MQFMNNLCLDALSCMFGPLSGRPLSSVLSVQWSVKIKHRNK